MANLNRQRVEGKLCDISIHVQGRVFRAHRAVLAASSPYFHDQVLLKNMTSIVLPNVMDPGAFETVLGSAYTGRLSMAPEEIVNFLTVGSVLQMWHIVDKCTELLKEGRAAPMAPGPSSSSSTSSSSSSSLRGVLPEEEVGKGELLEGEEEEGSEDGDGARRPLYVQPSIVPQKQWVYVKQEWLQEDLVLTCEEDEDPVEGPEQVNFCESSEDFPSPYEGLEEGGGPGGGPPGGPGPFPPRSLLPMDMQGNQILVFPPPAPPVEHGAVQLGAGGAEGNKIFMCHCGKAFSHKSMRDRHVNMHLNLRPFDCPVCGKKFKMKHHLTEHMKTHTGLKPYQCGVCAKKFMWRDSFMRHKGHCERRHRLAGTLVPL
uniref:Zinc finger and BTB domain containing 22 n=1 Tax=Calidris pygmaea TaxID=425635 RepID=A0A8C3JTR7_9CHAR